jgi:hypothetical protein
MPKPALVTETLRRDDDETVMQIADGLRVLVTKLLAHEI